MDILQKNDVTIIIKFQQATRLSEIFGKATGNYQIPGNFFDAFDKAATYYETDINFTPSDVDSFWKMLLVNELTLTFLFSETPVKLILNILQRAQNRISALVPGFNQTHRIMQPLQSANLFTYFQLVCRANKADSILKQLAVFTPESGSKMPLLELVYLRGVFIDPTPSPQSKKSTFPTRSLPVSTNFIDLLGLPPVDSKTQLTPVCIHDIEQGWSHHADFSSTLTIMGNIQFPLSPVPSNGHGCWVLGLLAAQSNQVTGIVPNATFKLYSSNITNTLDDALLYTFDSAAQQDVILIEQAVTSLSTHDGTYSRNPLKYPVETDQACYDLIWLATHELGLTVVECGGSSLMDLTDLDRKKFTPHRIDPTTTVQRDSSDPRPIIHPELIPENIRQRPRYLIYKPNSAPTNTNSDSGAILVGAAKKLGSQWINKCNFGSRIDCLAPGENLNTTSLSNGYYSGFGETSGATALVAGLVARINQQGWNLSPQTIRQAIRNQCGTQTLYIEKNSRCTFPRFDQLVTLLQP